MNCLRLRLLTTATVLCLHAICWSAPPSNPVDFREFHDQQGRAVQAKVLDIDGDHVTIQRRDGTQFTLKTSLFSKEDQEYLRSLTTSTQPKLEPGENWPGFRGPGGMGVSDATGLPQHWNENEHVAWKTPLPGSGSSSPITFGPHIYVTTYSGYLVPGQSDGDLDQLKRHLVALRRDNGQIVWDRAVPAKLPEEERIRDHGYAASTPVADPDRVYVFFGKSGVLAFDHEGNQLWQADVGTNTHGWGSGASLLLYKDLVIVNASIESESLVALDKRTGEQRWRVPEIREAWNTPILVIAESGREELVIARHGDVLAFDPKSGSPLWSCETDIRWYMVPTAVAADGVVYVFGGRSGTASLAIRAGGSGNVTSSHRLWTSRNGSNVTSPIYLDKHLYWMSEKLGIAYCAKADSGELVYQERLEDADQVYASPILAEGRLHYLTRSGRMFLLAAAPEFQQLAVNRLNDGTRFDASPAVDGSRLLVRSGTFLYCLAP